MSNWIGNLLSLRILLQCNRDRIHLDFIRGHSLQHLLIVKLVLRALIVRIRLPVFQVEGGIDSAPILYGLLRQMLLMHGSLRFKGLCT